MATTASLIDHLLANYSNVTANDADNTARRARLLQFCQEAFDWIWNSGDYTFSYTTGTVSITSGSDSGDLPADFMEFGVMGGIFDNSTLGQMEEITPVRAYADVIAGAAGNNRDQISLYGINTSTARLTLKTPGNVGANTTIKVLYRSIPATLADSATVATSNLYRIPLAYHNTVITPLAVSKTLASMGDVRAGEFRAEAERGLRVLQARERARKTVTQFLPYAGALRQI